MQITAKADVWSLGGILAFVMNNENPWQGLSEEAIVDMNLNGTLPHVQ